MSRKHLLALHRVCGSSPRRFRQLLNCYAGDPLAAWQDQRHWPSLSALRREGEDLAAAARRSDVERIYDEFLRSGASLCCQDDANYPPLLREIYDPPVLLFYYGMLPDPQDVTLAMVGSRRATAYGREVAEVLAKEVARSGIWVVSGLARGIDTCCHRGAIKGQGRTLAVLGSGIDVKYPAENVGLKQEIAEHGGVISEFPLGMPPLRQNFPIRNRLISGISRGVAVIEAGEKSGSLLTVDYALEQGRDVFAVPGPITSDQSRGVNSLLQRGGAQLVMNSADLIESYRQQLDQRALRLVEDKPDCSSGEQDILDWMSQPVYFDDVVQKLGQPPQKVAAMLTMWEIRGLIKQLPGRYYQRKIKNL